MLNIYGFPTKLHYTFLCLKGSPNPMRKKLWDKLSKDTQNKLQSGFDNFLFPPGFNGRNTCRVQKILKEEKI